MKQYRFDSQAAITPPASRKHDTPKHVLLFAFVLVALFASMAWKLMS